MVCKVLAKGVSWCFGGSIKICVCRKVGCGEEEILVVFMFVDTFLEVGDSCLFALLKVLRCPRKISY